MPMASLKHNSLFRSLSMKSRRPEQIVDKKRHGSQKPSSYSLDDMVIEMSQETFEGWVPGSSGINRTQEMQCLIIPDKVILTEFIRQQSLSLNSGCGRCSHECSDQAGFEKNRTLGRSASLKSPVRRNLSSTNRAPSDDRGMNSKILSRSKTLQSFSPQRKADSEVQLRRCISLYERKRTPHSCCHAEHTELSPKPSPWAHRCSTSPRERKDSKDSLRRKRTPSSLSLDSVGLSNGRNSDISLTPTSTDFEFDSFPHTPKVNDKTSVNGIETPKSTRPSFIPRPVTPARDLYQRPRCYTISEPVQIRPAIGYERSNTTNLKRSQSFKEKKKSGVITSLPSPTNALVKSGFSQSQSRNIRLSIRSETFNDFVHPAERNSNIPDEEDSYPDPKPPGKTRAEVYNPRDYNHVDQHVSKGDKSLLLHSFDDLLAFLLEDLSTDIAKVRALYRWLVTQHLPLTARPAHRNLNTPEGFLFNISRRRATYSELFALLCRKAGIQCVIIHGIAKGVNYSVGEKVTPKKGRNSWNAVYIENGWHFVHPYWATHSIHGYRTGRWAVVECDDFHLRDLVPEATKTTEVNDFYFLTDPDKFITKCFPDDSMWQLLHKPLSKAEFEDLPFLQPSFYHLKLSVHETYSCVVRTDNGKARVNIAVPSDRGRRYQFGYKLHARQFVDSEGEYDFMLLSRYILHYIHEDTAVFEVRFPIVGTFKLELHCKDPKKPLTSDWICDYKIICSDAMPECEPLPIVPQIGWGPGEALDVYGIECLTYKQPEVSLDGDTVTCVRFALPKNQDIEFEADLFSNYQSADELRNHVSTETDDEHFTVKVSPPAEGEYALQIFVKEENGDRKNVCNFLMHRTQIVEDPELADIRAELIKATENGDVDSLSHWLDMFVDHNMDDRGDLSKAKKKLLLAKLNRDIREAIERKDLDLLEKTLHSASDTTIRQSLGDLAVQAEAVRSRLRRLKRLRHEVLAMDQKTISEIKSYPKPPAPVHGVMAATFLLLGNKESDLKKWSKIQGLISKRGKDGLKRRVAEFNIGSVKPEVLTRVHTILSRYDLETVQIASAGAATFYQWTISMTGEEDTMG